MSALTVNISALKKAYIPILKSDLNDGIHREWIHGYMGYMRNTKHFKAFSWYYAFLCKFELICREERWVGLEMQKREAWRVNVLSGRAHTMLLYSLTLLAENWSDQ